jgi:hypothetical protein
MLDTVENCIFFRREIKTMEHKYKKSLIYFCIVAEKLHRFVFDYIYIQPHEYYKRNPKWYDFLILLVHKKLCKMFPQYRSYLKYWKPILKRAYHQHRISLFNWLLLLKLKKINTARYSSIN